jgi:hypothetical protein
MMAFIEAIWFLTKSWTVQEVLRAGLPLSAGDAVLDGEVLGVDVEVVVVVEESILLLPNVF